MNDEKWRQRRENLMAEIQADMRATSRYTGRDHLSERVEAAMRQVPRHLFVPLWSRGSAYGNYPLPIGFGQTISQPYIVALMTDLLDLKPTDTVLEIGTGCGYQTAVLAMLAHRVCTVEVVPELLDKARKTLAGLGIDNVEARVGNGYDGWPEPVLFDAIIVTAAAPEVPESLLAQLGPGGRMVIPVGEPGFTQDLLRLQKQADGEVAGRPVLPVAFVPMVRDDEKGL
ncbi:MAG TPA: protein-L-isoaspartate(D-aspartate) O-methyltransferase [Mariprofundaceae bacterium]|nr:protein-L-isoaspartate(D-aspartate) O-methyltransferase [Mariprofundaceae bacterium]